MENLWKINLIFISDIYQFLTVVQKYILKTFVDVVKNVFTYAVMTPVKPEEVNHKYRGPYCDHK